MKETVEPSVCVCESGCVLYVGCVCVYVCVHACMHVCVSVECVSRMELPRYFFYSGAWRICNTQSYSQFFVLCILTDLSFFMTDSPRSDIIFEEAISFRVCALSYFRVASTSEKH